jgi:hypothetical protein
MKINTICCLGTQRRINSATKNEPCSTVPTLNDYVRLKTYIAPPMFLERCFLRPLSEIISLQASIWIQEQLIVHF